MTLDPAVIIRESRLKGLDPDAHPSHAYEWRDGLPHLRPEYEQVYTPGYGWHARKRIV